METLGFSPGESVSKKAKVYLLKGRIVNGEYYAKFLDGFNDDLVKNKNILPKR